MPESFHFSFPLFSRDTFAVILIDRPVDQELASPGLFIHETAGTGSIRPRESINSLSSDGSMMPSVPPLVLSVAGVEFASLFFIPASMSFMLVCHLKMSVTMPHSIMAEVRQVMEKWTDTFFSLFNMVRTRQNVRCSTLRRCTRISPLWICHEIE